MPASACKNFDMPKFVFPPASTLLGGDERDFVILSSFFVNGICLLEIAQWMTVKLHLYQ